MADDDGNGNDDGNGDGQGNGDQSGSQLRATLEQTIATNKQLTGRLMIYESGLGHLTEKQRNAVVRDASEGNKELTPDLLKTAAKELGFPTEPPKQQAQNDGDDNGQQNQNGQEGNDDGTGEGVHVVDESLTYMDVIEQGIRAGNAAPAPDSFEHKMKNAKSPEEVQSLIRQEGHKHGIVLADDLE